MIAHPSSFITPQLVDALRKLAPEAEQLKRLHPQQLDIIYDQKWFKLFIPKFYKGLGLDLPHALQMEEALAWTDGSVGWTVTLCTGAGWFAGFLPPAASDLFFNDPHVCIAGSGKLGVAKVTENGYSISGKWDYATGALHATAFTANCMIEENGSLLANKDGSPFYRSFIFRKNEVNIIENWQPIGMIATGSNAFEVKELLLDKDRSFFIEPHAAYINEPLYHYPFLQFAETTLAVNLSGMAIRFFDLCEIILKQKINTLAVNTLNRSIHAIAGLRKEFYDIVTDSFSQTGKNNMDAFTLQQVSIISRQLAHAAIQSVDELYPFCGVEAANSKTEINRVWRNLHTASQHSLFSRNEK